MTGGSALRLSCSLVRSRCFLGSAHAVEDNADAFEGPPMVGLQARGGLERLECGAECIGMVVGVAQMVERRCVSGIQLSSPPKRLNG
jgi:hypothetical protein